MQRFLSIDFDYLVGCTAKERTELFPCMDETYSFEEQSAKWREAYQLAPKRLTAIGVHKDFQLVDSLCCKYRGFSVVEDSHKHIYELIMKNTLPNEAFAVYNIDFHHDMYYFRLRGEEVNCSNWATVLRERRPKMQYYWIKREDSEASSLGGRTDAILLDIENLCKIKFDYLYLCRSGVWSPPHLDRYFMRLFARLHQAEQKKLA